MILALLPVYNTPAVFSHVINTRDKFHFKKTLHCFYSLTLLSIEQSRKDDEEKVFSVTLSSFNSRYSCFHSFSPLPSHHLLGTLIVDLLCFSHPCMAVFIFCFELLWAFRATSPSAFSAPSIL